MEIDLANPTAEQLEALKTSVPGLSGKLGIMVVDPEKPLTREQMDGLKIEHKISGKDQTFTVFDAVQGKSLADGAADKIRQATEQAKELEPASSAMKVLEEFRQAQAEGKLPSEETTRAVAKLVGADGDALVAQYQGNGEDETGNTQPKGKPNMEPAAKPKTIEDLYKEYPELKGRILPSKYHGDFVGELMNADAEKVLKETIAARLEEDPKFTKILKDIGDDKAKAGILAMYKESLLDTVESNSRGRIEVMRNSGTGGDILAEIPNIVSKVVEKIDPSRILDLAAPQPILLGAGEPDEMPLTVLSNEKVDVPELSDPNWAGAKARQFAQKLATTKSA